MNNRKITLASLKAVDLRLNVQKKQVLKYKKFLDTVRKNANVQVPKTDYDNLNSNVETDLKAIPNIYLKSEKIEEEISKNQKTIKKIDYNIEKYLSSDIDIEAKEKLFEQLELDILQLEKAVEILRKENQMLRKELELLIEKKEKESQAQNLKTENQNLKEKIETLKNKTGSSIKDFENKNVNKITYRTNVPDKEHYKER